MGRRQAHGKRRGVPPRRRARLALHANRSRVRLRAPPPRLPCQPAPTPATRRLGSRPPHGAQGESRGGGRGADRPAREARGGARVGTVGEGAQKARGRGGDGGSKLLSHPQMYSEALLAAEGSQ
ncbi:hypothetical protein GUJ93_ZPchr0002g25380 [Zizania palustris]|uniref:Uncharacterized protein n=1 Tax=Zizania palustris TaxID=103762 RepID=A0A8J5V3I7_ZIZPA|nr:hypothetical protein GUJ93_ZPchr0002g25380 [Zizania palustris]